MAAYTAFITHAQPHGAADFLMKKRSHILRKSTSRDSARFKHDDAASLKPWRAKKP